MLHILHKEFKKMKENSLIGLIGNLTEEEIDKIIEELPKLIELLNKPDLPSPQEQNEPTP